MRIVSLLASATDIVCALGAAEQLVGRSHECDYPEWVRALPPCSEPAFDIDRSSGEIDREVKRRIRAGEPLYHLHADLIRDLRPDVVIAQDHCDVCAVTPADVERSGCSLPAVHQVSLSAASLEGIFQSVVQIARILAMEDRGSTLVDECRERLNAVCERVHGRRRPTVVAIEWTDPLFSMGNWGPELVAIAGGNPLIGRAGEHSVGMEFERLRDADPEVLIVAPCGFGLERALKDRPVLEANPSWWDLRAVRSVRVAFADGNLFFNRSGTTVVRTAEILAEMLHGEVFGETSEGVHWRWADTP